MTAYAAAHDLRAPVRHIKAWAKAVLDIEADVLSDEGIEKLDAIEASTTRMEQLIRSLLGFAQVNANSPVMDTIEVDDDPIELALAVAAVESSGVEILQSQSAVQALDVMWTFSSATSGCPKRIVSGCLTK